MDKENIQINFTIERRELSALRAAITRAVWARPENRALKNKFIGFNVLVWIPVGMFVGHSVTTFERGGWMGVSGLALAICAMWLYGWMLRKVGDRLPSDEGCFLGPKAFYADETGVSEKASGSSGSVTWRSVLEIVRSGDYVLIFIDRHLAYFVPTRAIGDDEQVAGFIAGLRELKARAVPEATR